MHRSESEWAVVWLVDGWEIEAVGAGDRVSAD